MRPASRSASRKKPTINQPKMSTVAAANQPQLAYSIAPTSVAVGSQLTFSFVATNSGSSAVTVKAYSDSIVLGNLAQLTNTTISPKTPPTPWQATPSGQTLQFWVLSDVVLKPGDSVTIQLTVTVLTTPGTASLSVTEKIGGITAKAPDLPVLIQDALSITAVANPSSIGQQRAVTLQWNTIGGSYVTISPGTNQQYPAGTSNALVTPNQNTPQTVYTLTVYQGLNKSTYNVTVNVCSPLIKSFLMSPSNALLINQSIQALWTTQYGTQITMSPPLGESPFVQASGTQSFTPSNALPSNALSEVFTITAYGYQGPVQQTFTLNFAPMRIRYLRFSSFPTLQQPIPPIIFEVFNAQPGTSLNATATPIILTAVGPGGPATAQLDGSGPEVQVMLANPSPVPHGQSTVISYLVKNVITLTLNPGNVPLTFDANGNGSTTVQPAQSTTYILVASNGASTVTSELDVSVT